MIRFSSFIIIVILSIPVHCEMIYQLQNHLPKEIKPIQKTEQPSQNDQQFYIEMQFIEIARNTFDKLSLPFPFLSEQISFDYAQLPSISLEKSSLQNSVESLLQNGNAKLLAAPKILVRNERESTIIFGDKIPYLTSTFNGQYYTSNLKMIDTGITLKTTPSALPGGKAVVSLEATVSSVKLYKDFPEGSYPIVSSRQLETVINLKENKVKLVGGIFQESERKNTRTWHLLSKTPFLNKLVPYNHVETDHSNVLIFMKITRV